MAIKTVHLTNYYHPQSGGISTAYNKLLEGANAHKRYVRLIVPGEHDRVEEVGEFGRIYFVKAGYSPVFDKRYRILLPWKTYIFDQSPIKKILREEKPDLIEIGEKYTLSLMAGLIRKGIMNVSKDRPVLVHYSCERMDDNVRAFISEGRGSRWFTRAIMRNYLFPMFDFHLTNSEYTADELREAATSGPQKGKSFRRFCWRLLKAPRTAPLGRIFVNPCGVDIKTFSAARRDTERRKNICREYSLPEDAVLLLYAGRISPEKNVGLLPEIIRILSANQDRDYRMLVAGGGPETSNLAKSFESTAPGKAKMLGHLNAPNQLADLFANCDAFVHPNPREPFGITPLEAMASGLPVAAPRSGGVLSYANDENAWLCEPDAESFAKAIVDITNGGPRRQHKVEKAMRTAHRFDWQTSTSNLFAAYDKMYEEFTLNRPAFVYKDAAEDIHITEGSVSHA